MIRRTTCCLALLLLVGLGACEEEPSTKLDGGRDLWLRLDGGAQDLLPPFSFPEAGDSASADTTLPGDDHCVGATALTLAGGEGTVSGTTKGAFNEYGLAIRCGGATPLVGPQRYHAVQMTQEKIYRLSLTPQFEASLYLFSQCGADLINVDCASQGATGVLLAGVPRAKTRSVLFTAPATGTYLVAVDSAVGGEAGAYTLGVSELPVPANGRCAAPATVTLSGGQATVKGSTLGAKNELGKQVGCQLGLDFDGPQVYYQVSLSQGTWYRFTLTPSFTAGLYVVSSLAGCTAANLNIDCGGRGGTVLPLVSAGQSEATLFSPLSSGTYLVAVDSLDPSASGDFTLLVEQVLPQAGETCGRASPLVLRGGGATVRGDTSALLNDSGAHLACGGPALVGHQAYHGVFLRDRVYEVTLRPAFNATLATGSSCLSLPADCASGGLTGGAVRVPAGGTGTLTLDGGAAAHQLIVVDSADTAARGKYALQIQEQVTPTNGSCGSPRALPLGGSPTVTRGETGPLKNDLQGVSCGSKHGPFDGPQAYYRLSLLAGQTYRVLLQPEATFDGALYAFPAATPCTAAGVDGACKGLASDRVGAGLLEQVTLAPAADTDYVVAVDAWSPSEVGRYTLTVSW